MISITGEVLEISNKNHFHTKMDDEIVNIEIGLDKTNYFTYQNKKYPINIDIFRLFSKANFDVQENIPIITSNEEQNIVLNENSIINFIQFCHNKNCEINDENLRQLEFLAQKYNVNNLTKKIKFFTGDKLRKKINEKALIFDKCISDFTAKINSNLNNVEIQRQNVLKKQQFLSFQKDKSLKELCFILLDKSGSMTCKSFNNETRFDTSKKIFTQIVKNISNYYINIDIGSIMFSGQIEVRNQHMDKTEEFLERMIIKGEKPSGPSYSFKSMLKAAEIINKKCEDQNLGNITKRIIIISDGDDPFATYDEKASITNFLISNKIKVDSIIISKEIIHELVLVSRFTGGACFISNKEQGYFDFINQLAFINSIFREFGDIHQPNLIAEDFEWKRTSIQDTDSIIKIKHDNK